MSAASSRALRKLSETTGDFWVDFQIPVLETSDSLVFFKYAYSRYHPCILKSGLMEEWAALQKWDHDYLCDKMGEKPISVNLTKEGRADSVQYVPSLDKEYFLYPAEVKMTMREFFDCLVDEHSNVVPYLSQQNDNFRTEFQELLEDINVEIPLAKDVFESGTPEAVNLWIGDERSVSSVHKDHYENFYAVIRGAKTFTLLPPTDIAFLPENTYPTMRYECANSSDRTRSLVLTDDGCPASSIKWIPLDPDDPGVCEKYPTFSNTHPIRCTVCPGEILYIPAMWYHRVSQEELTVAINFWYDQRFDFRYVFHSVVQQLSIGDDGDDDSDNEN